MTSAHHVDGALAVSRPLGNGTEFEEYWVLDQRWWSTNNEGFPDDDPMLRCWVGKVNAVHAGSNVYPPDNRTVHDEVKFSEAPEEVQREFVEATMQLGELREVVLKHIGGDDE